MANQTDPLAKSVHGTNPQVCLYGVFIPLIFQPVQICWVSVLGNLYEDPIE